MKAVRISEPATWRPDSKTLLHFGTYRVPEDMSEELAARAVADGVAQWVQTERETKPAAPALETKPAGRAIRSKAA